MEKLQMPSADSRALVPDFGKRSLKKSLTLATMPPVSNRYTDVEIPLSTWSAWHEAGKPRELCRALTAAERSALEARLDELLSVVQPCGDRDVNRVALSLTDMFGGFPSLRHRDDEAVIARIDGARRILMEFPVWAIEKACRKIQMNGVWRDGKFDRQWPPSDAEIAAAVRDEARLYADQHRQAIALLSATVEGGAAYPSTERQNGNGK